MVINLPMALQAKFISIKVSGSSTKMHKYKNLSKTLEGSLFTKMHKYKNEINLTSSSRYKWKVVPITTSIWGKRPLIPAGISTARHNV